MLDQVIAPAAVRQIPLAQIDADETNVRRTAASALEDEHLVASLAAQGLIQPIVVRPASDGRFTAIAGARRLRAALVLGWPAIDAQVLHVDEIQAKAIQAAENAHRAAMHPIDVWKAMVSLQETGMPLQLAAQCLNVSERIAIQLDKLGRIAEPLIEAMRETGVPDTHYLATIANAPLDAQISAFKKHAKRLSYGTWYDMQLALRVRRVSQKAAIFKIASAPEIVWQEDVFAEPGSGEAITTSDLMEFKKHQVRGLVELVEKRQKKGEAVERAAWDQSRYSCKIPAGYSLSYGGKPKSMKLPEGDNRLLLMAIDDDGLVRETMVTKRDTAPATKAGAAPVDAAQKAEPRAITNAGLRMIAEAQTQAIRARFQSNGPRMRPDVLLRLLCVAVCGGNVDVRKSAYGKVDLGDIRRRLLTPEGHLQEAGDVREIASDLLANMLFASDPVTGFGSGGAAAAIALNVMADELMPPLDSPEFLKTLSTAELKKAAEAMGITGPKTGATLREKLAGKIGSKWLPDAAGFVAVPLEGQVKYDEEDLDDEAAA